MAEMDIDRAMAIIIEEQNGKPYLDRLGILHAMMAFAREHAAAENARLTEAMGAIPGAHSCVCRFCGKEADEWKDIPHGGACRILELRSAK